MPTGNEYSDVRFGSGDQSYKQSDREMSGGNFGQSTGQTAQQPSSGQYPNTFDGSTPSEPETISHYPDHAFQRVSATGPAQHYGQTERESVSGEYGQSDGITAPYYPGTNIVPSPTPSKQFSSDKSSTPQAMAEEANTCSSKFYELQHFLNNSPYVAGSRVCHELDEIGTPAHPAKAGLGDGKTGPA